MADLAGNFRFLVESTRRFVGLLFAPGSFERGAGGERKERERGAALVRHIRHTTQGLEAQIEAVESEFASASTDIDKEAAIKKIRLWASYAHFMRRAVPWLEDAAEPPLDMGAVYFIDAMAKALVKGRVDAIPTRADEYSTERRPFQTLFKSLKLSPEPGPSPVILNFPASEATSFPLLPLFGHEIGHTAVQESGLVQATLEAARADSGFVDLLSKSQGALAAEMSDNNVKAWLIVNERLENWTEELLCDQLALQYLGPSFLLALAAYLVPLSWDAPGPRHPPTTMRIAHLLRWIERSPWKALLEERIPESLDWLKQVAATPRRRGVKSPLAALLGAVDSVGPHVAAAVSGHLGPDVFNANDYLGKAGHLDQLLRLEILPVQHPSTGEAFEGRAILTAAWLALHEGVRNRSEPETPADICRTVVKDESHAFFTKALEMSHVLATWGELQ